MCPTARAVMVVRFHVVSPASKQRTFTVRLPIMLGRGEEAKFRVQHDLVSRRHCEFFERQGQLYVRDLGSTNGTFLNDEQVPASTKTAVMPGAVVRVGGLTFTVEYDAPTSGDSTATFDGQARPADAAAEEGRVAADAKTPSDLEEMPDFKIEHAEQPDDVGAGSVVAADAAAPAAETVPVEGPAAATPEQKPDWPSIDAAAHDDAPDDDELNAFFQGLK